MDGLRILVVAALAPIIEPVLVSEYPTSRVTTAVDSDALRSAVSGQPRYDVALVDLVWSDSRLEWNFDGLDAIALLHQLNRNPAVVLTVQGHGLEADHLDEAADRGVHPEVVGVYSKLQGIGALRQVIDAAAVGAPGPFARRPGPRHGLAIHEYFRGGGGRTAGVLAAAAASGRATNYQALAALAHVAPDTATKLVKYLGPLIRQRQETPPDQPLTQAAVYRWCGEHARYLLSWHRRHNPHHAINRWGVAGAGAG